MSGGTSSEDMMAAAPADTGDVEASAGVSAVVPAQNMVSSPRGAEDSPISDDRRGVGNSTVGTAQETAVAGADHMEQYRDHLAADTFEAAMESLLQGLGSPPQWNAWQSAAWKFAPYYEEDFVAYSTPPEKQRYFAKLYKEMQIRVFGDRWRRARAVMPAVTLFERFSAFPDGNGTGGCWQSGG